MEKVDIIMAVYNCEKYVKEAITSVKKQSYTNWDLIIIDDKSTDKTLDMIKDTIIEVKQKVKIIKLKEHKGVAKARNIGIEESKNQYIAFLDADDIWDKEKLKKQIQFMKINSYNFTYTRFYYKKGKREKTVGIFPKSLNYKQALKNTFILTSTVMINTKEISKELIKMPDVKSEDTATWWHILKDNNIAYGINEELAKYRIHNKSLSFNKFKSLKRTWQLYRKQEKINIIKSTYYFINYIFRATIKRII